MFALTIVLYALRVPARRSSRVAGVCRGGAGPGISPVAGALIDRVGSVWAITVDMAASAGCVTALAVVDRSAGRTQPVLLR